VVDARGARPIVTRFDTPLARGRIELVRDGAA
jgi:hypothetical protein